MAAGVRVGWQAQGLAGGVGTRRLSAGETHQADLGGWIREVGDEPVLLHLLKFIEDGLDEAQAHMLRTGCFHGNFIEIHDTGNYGLVPSYLHRGLKMLPFYKKYAPVFDKVYPERLRACFVVRAPAAFSGVWRLVQPLIPEATKLKVRFRGHAAATWVEELEGLAPGVLPPWLRSDDPALLLEAEPWGGLVPQDTAEELS